MMTQDRGAYYFNSFNAFHFNSQIVVFWDQPLMT